MYVISGILDIWLNVDIKFSDTRARLSIFTKKKKMYFWFLIREMTFTSSCYSLSHVERHSTTFILQRSFCHVFIVKRITHTLYNLDWRTWLDATQTLKLRQLETDPAVPSKEREREKERDTEREEKGWVYAILKVNTRNLTNTNEVTPLMTRLGVNWKFPVSVGGQFIRAM